MGSNCTKRNKVSVEASGPGGSKLEEIDHEVNEIPSEVWKVLHDKRNSQVKNTLESPTTSLKQGDASSEEDWDDHEWVERGQRDEIDKEVKETSSDDKDKALELASWNWKSSGKIDFVNRQVYRVHSARVQVTSQSASGFESDTEVI